MDAVKKLPPAQRPLKYKHANRLSLTTSPTRKSTKEKSASKQSPATSKSPKTTKSATKASNEPLRASKSPNQKSPRTTKLNRKTKYENTCPEDDPLVAPRLSYSFSDIQKAGQNKQIISFSLCHGLKIAIPPKMDDSKFDLCSRIGSKHMVSKHTGIGYKQTSSRMFK